MRVVDSISTLLSTGISQTCLPTSSPRTNSATGSTRPGLGLSIWSGARPAQNLRSWPPSAGALPLTARTPPCPHLMTTSPLSSQTRTPTSVARAMRRCSGLKHFSIDWYHSPCSSSTPTSAFTSISLSEAGPPLPGAVCCRWQLIGCPEVSGHTLKNSFAGSRTGSVFGTDPAV